MPPLRTGILLETQQRILSLYRTYGELALVAWDGIESCLCGLANVYVDYLEQRANLLVNAIRGSICKIVDHMHLEKMLEMLHEALRAASIH